MTKAIVVVQLLVHCLSGVTSPAVLGLNKRVGGPNVSLTPPDRHAKDPRREHNRAYPEITLADCR